MSKKTFTKEQIEMLAKNEYVKKISDKAITYSKEFQVKRRIYQRY
jgi:hypothetical protein